MRGDRRDDRSGGSRGGGRGLNPNYFLPKPVKVGDEIDVTIEATASKGDGIAKKDGFVVFVKDAKQGQTVRVRITDVRTRFAIGEIIGESSAAPAAEPAPEPAPEEQPSSE
ncbi:MAG: TRAM domain-containing protein [Candidatus Micrarchaeota archaeon]|nr:TRAM domain-containing protein [Candidatus Micrarchaeota archaeon]MDE1824218.1 TRAM domain-containing protein [Candidatus Micrarchaeota archaeon]MDE1849655.1 TRAM domain-containing protein [Candidatus Micrarchaeota archaeon]